MIDDDLIAHYSMENDKHDNDFECGRKNHINNSHVWVSDYNDLEQIEKMKTEVLTRVGTAKDEAEKQFGKVES